MWLHNTACSTYIYINFVIDNWRDGILKLKSVGPNCANCVCSLDEHGQRCGRPASDVIWIWQILLQIGIGWSDFIFGGAHGGKHLKSGAFPILFFVTADLDIKFTHLSLILMIKLLTPFVSLIFATSCEYLFSNRFSRMCLLEYFKHEELKMSKTYFFKWDSTFVIVLYIFWINLKIVFGVTVVSTAYK